MTMMVKVVMTSHVCMTMLRNQPATAVSKEIINAAVALIKNLLFSGGIHDGKCMVGSSFIVASYTGNTKGTKSRNINACA